MAHDEARIRDFARSYTEAWCSHDPTRVADHFVPGGTIAINGGDPIEVTEITFFADPTLPGRFGLPGHV